MLAAGSCPQSATPIMVSLPSPYLAMCLLFFPDDRVAEQLVAEDNKAIVTREAAPAAASWSSPSKIKDSESSQDKWQQLLLAGAHMIRLVAVGR
jgi:hypothetical protein